MGKTLLNADEIAMMVTAGLRRLAVCTKVTKVTLNRVSDPRAESNWEVDLNSMDASVSPDCKREAIAIQVQLRREYDVQWRD